MHCSHSLWQQLAHSGGAQGGEEGPSVNGAEVRQVAMEVELVSNDSESRALGVGEGGEGGQKLARRARKYSDEDDDDATQSSKACGPVGMDRLPVT